MAEAAGLVLGVIPLVIEGLKLYVKSFDTARKYWKYKEVVSSLAQELQVQETIHRNNCEILLQDLVTEQELVSLLQSPGGVLWKHEDLEKKLAEALGESFGLFSETLSSMNKIVESLQTRIGMENGEVKWSDEKTFRSEWKRVVVTLCEEETKALLAKFGANNSNLVTLLGQRAKIKPSKSKQAAKYAEFYAKIQEHARSMYLVLKNGFGRQCGCTNIHEVKLRLEARLIEKNVPEPTAASMGPEFRVLFHLPSSGGSVTLVNWKETVLQSASGLKNLNRVLEAGNPELIQSKTSTPRPALQHSISDVLATIGHSSLGVAGGKSMLEGVTTRFDNSKKKKKVTFVSSTPHELRSMNRDSAHSFSATDIEFEELCTKLWNLRLPNQLLPNTEADLGVLIHGLDGNNRLRVRLTDDLFDKQPSTVSLIELLSINESLRRREDRLILGVKLASSMLQLSMTSWLREEWNGKDIIFLNRQDEDAAKMISNPYISGPSIPQPVNDTVLEQNWLQTCSFQLRNRTMFNLGIILLELWFGEAIEDLRPSQEEDSRIEAVRFCLSLDLGGHKSNSLDADSFREEVWTNVVWPLEEYLKCFSGKGLSELLL